MLFNDNYLTLCGGTAWRTSWFTSGIEARPGFIYGVTDNIPSTADTFRLML